jgi:hypothetical protein
MVPDPDRPGSAQLSPHEPYETPREHGDMIVDGRGDGIAQAVVLQWIR